MVKRIYGIIVILACLLTTSAIAHDPSHYTDQELRWLQSAIDPVSKGSCCTYADGGFVEEEIRNGEYWIQCPLDSPCPFKTWTRVPPERIIQQPNKLGRPSVWWFPATYQNGNLKDSEKVRCYAPGAGG